MSNLIPILHSQQWGVGQRKIGASNLNFEVPLPVSFPKYALKAIASSCSSNTPGGFTAYTLSTITLWSANENGATSYITIGG